MHLHYRILFKYPSSAYLIFFFQLCFIIHLFYYKCDIKIWSLAGTVLFNLVNNTFQDLLKFISKI